MLHVKANPDFRRLDSGEDVVLCTACYGSCCCYSICDKGDLPKAGRVYIYASSSIFCFSVPSFCVIHLAFYTSVRQFIDWPEA